PCSDRWYPASPHRQHGLLHRQHDSTTMRPWGGFLAVRVGRSPLARWAPALLPLVRRGRFGLSARSAEPAPPRTPPQRPLGSTSPPPAAHRPSTSPASRPRRSP